MDDPPTSHTTVHTVRYTAFSFRQLLDSLNVFQSFSKKSYSFGNACYECFFKYLKKEEISRKHYLLVVALLVWGQGEILPAFAAAKGGEYHG